jgi:hypothetical protein
VTSLEALKEKTTRMHDRHIEEGEADGQDDGIEA